MKILCMDGPMEDTVVEVPYLFEHQKEFKILDPSVRKAIVNGDKSEMDKPLKVHIYAVRSSLRTDGPVGAYHVSST